MALSKNKIPILFVEGVETATDEKLTTGALELDNVIFNKFGEVKKRSGLKRLSRLDIDNQPSSNLEVLGTFKNELIGIARDGFYSYYDAIDRWRKISDRTISSVTSTPVLRNTDNQFNPVSHTAKNVTLTAWEDSRGGVRLSIIDEISGQPYLSDKILDETGVNPKIYNFGESLYLFWVTQDNKLKAVVVRPSSPSTYTDELIFYQNVSYDNPFYDVTLRTQTWFVVAYNNIDDDFVIGYNNPTTGLPAQPYPDKLPDPVTHPVGEPIQFIKVRGNLNTSPRIFYMVYGLNDKIYVKALTDRFLELYTEELTTTYDDPILSCGIIQEDNVTTLYYHIFAGFPQDHRVETLKFDNTTGVIIEAPSILQRSVGLLSEPFVYDTRHHLIVSYESDLQSTNFVLDAEKGFLVAKLSPLITAGHNNIYDRLTGVTLFDENNYLYVGRVRTRTIQQDNVFLSTIGLYKYSIDLSIPRDNQIIESNENLFITSSLPLIYDGAIVTEAGFNVSPEKPFLFKNTEGNHKAGEYRYTIVYKWEDQQGQIHRSAPALSQMIETQIDDSVVIEIPTLRLTNLDTVMIEIYRTEDNGAIFYLIDTIPNSRFEDYLYYLDVIPDDDIIDNEILYTTGGVLGNDAPNGSIICEMWQNRLITAGSESKGIIYYSKENTTGIGTEFSSLFAINTGVKGGKITALKTLGDHLIVFKENTIGIVTGRGASATGVNSTYEYNLISADIGCRESNSVVQTSNFLMFKSSKGFYRMGMDMILEYVGTGVKKYREEVITSGVSLEGRDKIIFGTETGRALVFNSLFNIWTTFSNYGQVSAINRLGEYYFASPTGFVYKEDNGNYSDDGVPIKTTIQTNWIELGDLTGFQRVYTVTFLGQRMGNHSAKVELYYNYRSYENDTYEYEDYRDDIYGTEVLDNYGDSDPYGGRHNDYQFRVKPSKQKCTSVSIKISDYFEDNQPSAAFNLTSIVLEIGIKRGHYKLDKVYNGKTSTKK